MRTKDIFDPKSWRCWDGKDFTISFADPYPGPVARPRDHICTPVPYLDYANGINDYEFAHLFVATMWSPGVAAFGPAGLYFSSSPDMIHWTTPALAMTLNQFLRREPLGNWTYGYFSLIDPSSTDANFQTISDHPVSTTFDPTAIMLRIRASCSVSRSIWTGCSSRRLGASQPRAEFAIK